MTVVLFGQFKQRITGVLGQAKKIFKQCIADTGMFWFRELLPRHFTYVARAEYQYKPRTKGWQEDKRVIGKGEGRFLDNIMFGRTRMYTRQAPRVTATSARSVVRFSVPPYIRNPGHAAPEQHPLPVRELTTTSDKDKVKMVRFYETRLGELIGEARLRAAYVTIQF